MSDTSSQKHPIFAYGEDIAKLSTFAIGILYVLGVLISNIQLMALGVSDFSSFQTRNILTGFMFVLYLGLSILMLLPTAILAAVISRRFGKLTIWTAVNYVGLWIIFTALFAYSSAFVIGLLYPWGRPWIDINVRQRILEIEKFNLAIWEQFSTSYMHVRTSYSLIMLFLLFLTILSLTRNSTISRLIRSVDHEEEKADSKIPIMRKLLRPVVFSMLTLYLGIIIPPILFDYADEVYPNIRYNLGGGQPQIAELVLSGKRSEMAGVAGIRLCCDPGIQPAVQVNQSSAANTDQEFALKVNEVAIWYQSDKFLYVANPTGGAPFLGADPRSHVYAIDLKLVRNIHYLRKYAKVEGGGRILSVHPY